MKLRPNILHSLLNLSVIGAVEVDGVNRDAVGVPSNSTIGGLELGIGDTV